MSVYRTAAVAAALLLAACAQVDFQRYEGRGEILEGRGGTRQSIDGIDVWTNGSPPRRYRIVGVATVNAGDRRSTDPVVRNAVAAKVAEVGGSAAIFLGAESSFAGIVPVGGFAVAVNDVTHRFAIIQYEGPAP